MEKTGISLSVINRAMAFAIKAHHDTNQFYDKNPYSVHLGSVANYGWKYSHLLPEELRENAIAACWTHDTIEDTRQSYNDVKKATNEKIADITSTVTNLTRGKTRAERMPEWLYKEIHADLSSCFVKVCDRLANISNSSQHGHSMLSAYEKEHHHFKQMLWREELDPMFKEIESILYL